VWHSPPGTVFSRLLGTSPGRERAFFPDFLSHFPAETFFLTEAILIGESGNVQSDAELVRTVLDGQRETYSVLVKRHERAVRATAAGVLKDHHAAQDAAQEAFVAAYRKLGRLRRPAAFGPWVLKIARREAIRMAKKRRAFYPLDPQTERAETGSDGQLSEASRELLEAVMRLPKHERVAVMLRYFDGHDVNRIAEITARPVGTVTKQLSRARARLRKWIQEAEQ